MAREKQPLGNRAVPVYDSDIPLGGRSAPRRVSLQAMEIARLAETDLPAALSAQETRRAKKFDEFAEHWTAEGLREAARDHYKESKRRLEDAPTTGESEIEEEVHANFVVTETELNRSADRERGKMGRRVARELAVLRNEVIRVDDQCQSRIQRCEEEKMDKMSVVEMEKDMEMLKVRQAHVERGAEKKLISEITDVAIGPVKTDLADLRLNFNTMMDTVDARFEVQRNQYGKLEKRVKAMEEGQEQVAVKRRLSDSDGEVLDLLREELSELLEEEGDIGRQDVVARYGKSIVNRLIRGRYKLVLRDIRELKTIFNCPSDLMHVLDQIAAEIN